MLTALRRLPSASGTEFAGGSSALWSGCRAAGATAAGADAVGTAAAAHSGRARLSRPIVSAVADSRFAGTPPAAAVA